MNKEEIFKEVSEILDYYHNSPDPTLVENHELDLVDSIHQIKLSTELYYRIRIWFLLDFDDMKWVYEKLHNKITFPNYDSHKRGRWLYIKDKF